MLWRISLTDVNSFCTITNCLIVCSFEASHKLSIQESVPLLTMEISQCAREIFCSYQLVAKSRSRETIRKPGMTSRLLCHKIKHFLSWNVSFSNTPFPSSLVPLFQNECKCETFHMKTSPPCSFIFMQIKLILDSFWNRGTRELGIGLLFNITTTPLSTSCCFLNKI